MPVGLDAVIDILLEDLNRFLVSTLLKEAIFAIFFFNVFFWLLFYKQRNIEEWFSLHAASKDRG